MSDSDNDNMDDRRELRHSYRSLLATAQAQRSDLLADDGSALVATLQQANGFYRRVRTTTEGILDSRLLIFAADVSAQRAHQLRIDSSAFDTPAYVDHLAAQLQQQQLPTREKAWASLGCRAWALSRAPPRFSCLYGPLLAEKKPRRVAAQRRARQPRNTAEAARVENVDEADVRRAENQTTRLVQKVHKLLLRHGPINLFRFVTNPRSFAQSVENIFYVSFLIRDGKAHIDVASGQPVIEACEPPQQEDYALGLARKQLIFSLDEPTWREIIDVYAVEESVIPQRAAEQ
ncbi:hypothetical protein LPJ53_006333 [Coemansia erecta]|uniref:Non-structural maintenance of chromosomes element 4 n=1 Tax=Coemansia erecta TaxID=147472 RepID=A0A9W8CP58_9FUNG|nr:hypothetical protein LPJ53_006333 [Coemansia erecta]